MTKFTDEQIDAAKDAVAESLGDAYDCTRVWSAWSYGTMGSDDFSMVAEDSGRVHEITMAALEAIGGDPVKADLLAALKELVIDVRIAQGNMRAAAMTDSKWEGCAEAIQPRVDAALAAIKKAEGRHG